MADPSSSTAGDAASKQQHEVVMNDKLVIDYLKKKGLGTAAVQLEQQLLAATASSHERLQLEDAQSRNQRSLITKSTGSGYYGHDRDSAWPIVQWGVPDTTLAISENEVNDSAKQTSIMGLEEARAYLNAFCSIQLWVLSLPDHGHGEATRQVTTNPIRMAEQLIQAIGSLEQVIQQLSSKQQQQSDDANVDLVFYNLPPSCKPELLSICFALLVHTYCELLEVGMETTAHLLRDAFRPVYATLYATEWNDLDQCTTVEDIVRLNSYNSQHMETISALKAILVQIASYQSRCEELMNAKTNSNINNEHDTKIQEYQKNITLLQQKYDELSPRASQAYDKMLHVPFLRRARAVRWQLTISSATYGMLCAYMNSKDESLLLMSALLQTKCELHVERRHPLPFTPACVLMEDNDGLSSFDVNKVEINWAAPAIVNGQKAGEVLPFPKFHLDEEYDNADQASIDKKRVEFNRALLINGFRRLEAIERKREYESLPGLLKKRLKEDSNQIVAQGNPLKPSIMLMTLMASSSGPVLRSNGPSTTVPATNISSIWEESGIGLCCARASPPDGRRVAVGCDDSAIRIYDSMDTTRVEPSMVLLGHRNGFPVFDLDWNRDGTSLFSAGGDGAVRLWDTKAVGPFGEVADLSVPEPAGGISTISSSQTLWPVRVDDPTGVSGLKPENSAYHSGAALAVYRGHVPNTPIWSVSCAPSGYYFASAGADYSARLWVTDRATSPVRLFTGHTSANVNCVEWHPNCNYIITGADDKTARLWDIQSGSTVRLLDGCGAGINSVKISPNGQYAAASDYNGIVHIWDLGMGKKVTELRSQLTSQRQDTLMIHALSFSPCGTTLATGGDLCVNIWDVRSSTISQKPIIATPAHKYPTNKTIIMDLSYTKRNLLLSVGKVVTPVPLIIDEE
ncbi:hypothetical protein MPSEU_000232700 [Mayamaea pseudoterrestris]|nr:hypothetical protein MPSEU_000232700 [Mayamaea pseudoterrestris]